MDRMSRDKPIVTRTTRHCLQADGILRSTALLGAGQSLAEAKENAAAMTALAGGKRRPVLLDLGGVRKPLNRDARQFYQGPELAMVASATAVLISSPVSRVVGNFVLGASPPRMPTRLFTREEDALAWLSGFLE